jgi:hypothetical protein
LSWVAYNVRRLGEVRIIALSQPEQKFNFFTKDEDNKQQHNSEMSAEYAAK